MSHQWSRRNSHRASSRKKRRRRSVRSNSSFGGGLPDDENEILQMYGEDGELADNAQGLDTPQTLEDRIRDQKDIMENVKFQPWPIEKKLKVLRLARSFVVKHEGKLSRSSGYQHKGRQLLKQLKRSWKNLKYRVTPWEMRIKRIESHFGSVVTSYFIFLRWLLWINLWLTVVQLCFVILPEVLVGPPYGSTVRTTIPPDKLATAYDLKTIWGAGGVLRYSPLFYGYYGNAESIGNGYRLPLAYLLTTLVSFAYSFIVVLKKMASNSRQSRMSNKDEQFTFAWKLFTDWDYMVGHAETANTKHASIVTTMKESIVEEQEKKQEERKYLMIFLRVLSNIIIVMLLALSTYIIQLFVERSRKLELRKLADKDLNAGFWVENELTIIMTLITTLFPAVLDLISLMEKYHPRTSLRLQLARIFLLNLINLYTLFIALYNKQNDLKRTTLPVEQNSANASSCITVNRTVGTNSSTMGTVVSSVVSTTATTMSDTTFVTTASYSQDPITNTTCATNYTPKHVDFCWETMTGQEVFKLTIMDLIFVLGQILISDIIRSVFVKYCNNICCWDLQMKFPAYPDFTTAENLLHLINNQGMIWLGVFFSPGLALLNLLKLLLLMYVRCWTVMSCNVPQERIFRASRSNNFYFALLLVMLFLCMLPPLFAIVGIEPSPTCGPFSGLNKIYHVITATMEKELPAGVNSIIDYAASPGVILPVFMLMGMTIYYLVSIGRSQRDANNELRMMLDYERTEGRKKVYAMADAKRDLENPDGQKNAGISKMSSAVTSMLKAAQMAKALTSLSAEQKRKQNNTSDGSKKIAPAVRPKPHVPVAVVHGKRSLKRSAAAIVNKAVAVRRQRQQQQQSTREHTLAGTNGHMKVDASSSLDSPEASSNDEEEDMSNTSSRSSSYTAHHNEDPSIVVDDTGHLRPVTEDDVFLDEDSEDEEDSNDDDDVDDPVPHPGSSANTVNNGAYHQQQNAGRLRVQAKRVRSSQKIQPTGIPKITVVDFGENEVSSRKHADHGSSELHVEPTVIIENEQVSNRQKRLKKSRTHNRQTRLQAGARYRTHPSNDTNQHSSTNVTDFGHSGNQQTHHLQISEDVAPNTRGGVDLHSRGSKLKGLFKRSMQQENNSINSQTQNTSKSKFSNILARFQEMDENG